MAFYEADAFTSVIQLSCCGLVATSECCFPEKEREKIHIDFTPWLALTDALSLFSLKAELMSDRKLPKHI